MKRGFDLRELPTDFAIVEGQYDRWRRAQEGHENWALTAKRCVEFFEGEQWTDLERKILQDEGRPCITRNKIAPLMRLLLGYFRQNRYDIDYLPGNDGSGTQEIAETLTHIVKQIGEVNQSNWIDAQVFQDGLFTGRGFWDVRLDFVNNMLGEVRERVMDNFSVYIDPEADTYEPKGWNFVIENRWMSPVDIYLMYGKKALQEVNSIGEGYPITSGSYYELNQGDISPERFFGLDEFLRDDYNAGVTLYSSPFDHVNRHRKLVRVLDTQHRVLKKVQYFVDLETGQEKIIPVAWPREKVARVLMYAQSRNLPIDIRENVKKVVRWTTTAADRVLWDDWSPYDEFTVVPFFPYFRRGKTRGAIHDLIDPQTEINKRSSAMLHIIMTTANSGWISEEGSMEEDMDRSIEEEGARPGIHIKYKQGYQPPQRIQPGIPPNAMRMLVEHNDDDLKEISSINESALGNLDRVQSGRAIQSRQKQSLVGTDLYTDNFARSKELKGRKYLSLIQNFYTEERIIRTRGEDGKDEQIIINQRDAAGEIVNNVSFGVYQCSVDEAPTSSTFMQGQFEEAQELRGTLGIPIPDDVMIDLSSMPRKEAIKERLNEQRAIQEEMQGAEALAMKGQLGIPPDQPVPPVVYDPGPNAVPVNNVPVPPENINMPNMPLNPAQPAPEGNLTPTTPTQLSGQLPI